MRRRLQFSLVVLTSALALVRPAAAGVPDPALSTVTPVLVGDASGHPIAGGFEVIARQADGTPADPGTVITLSLGGTGAVPYSGQAAGTTLDCASLTLSRVADLDGRAVFFPRLGGFANTAVVVVRAEGVPLRMVPVRSTDLNASGATDLADLEHFRANFLGNRSAPETDFNGDGVTDVADLGIFRAELLSGVGGSPCP